tara:strand:+ start:1442 stop:1732 length:291 start_codon:yes stop_codon:yes gene_type:complete
MSDYNIECGWYKYPSESNTTNNGVLIQVVKATKKFVVVNIYNYFNDNYDLDNMDKRDLLFNFRQKVEGDYGEGGFIYPYPDSKSIKSYKLHSDFKE